MLLTRSPLSYPLRGNRVRLACVRHAASVDSEPGSNSHVKFAVPLRLGLSALTRADGLAQGRNSLTRSPVDMALCVVSYFVLVDGSPIVALARSDRRHPLTLDGLSDSAARLRAPRRRTLVVLARTI